VAAGRACGRGRFEPTGPGVTIADNITALTEEDMSSTADVQTALWASHHRLDAATQSLTQAEIAGPSYCSDWSTAQVLSHIGSGAQIFGLLLDAGLSGGEAPGREEFAKIWDVWNAMSSDEQAKSSLVADSAFLQRVDAVPDEQLDALQMNLFGAPADASRLLRMRLNEHAIHTWDVIVIREPSAEVSPDAVSFMIDSLDQVAARSGATVGGPIEVDITTSAPDRAYRLSVGETVTLRRAGTAGDDATPATATVRMPSESLVRLVYGRLDAEHTPASVEADGIDLNALRAVFPGF
jgi:uncharacterized protein (TIGR03083 family)